MSKKPDPRKEERTFEYDPKKEAREKRDRHRNHDRDQKRQDRRERRRYGEE